ncbi:hypothetical protein [Pullulanibacillus camelliae]|uniref:hypothetical protein n=1 Tax=Pullulanibacillus camelliae TaxID=1707096 RepID=UPI00166D5B50|nr:hypothetical protein [Pullulanibacillus camelliae]
MVKKSVLLVCFLGVTLITATGGGYGLPERRPIEKIRHDMKNGYFTKEQVERLFYLEHTD